MATHAAATEAGSSTVEGEPHHGGASLNAHGTMIEGRRPILELAPGDNVFHYNRHAVRAISRVTTAAHLTSRPAAYPERSEREPDNGWVASVETIDTDLLVDGHDVVRLLPHSTANLDKHGWVNRRYLSELAEEDAVALTRFVGVQLPLPDTLAGRPCEEVVDPKTQPTDDCGPSFDESRLNYEIGC